MQITATILVGILGILAGVIIKSCIKEMLALIVKGNFLGVIVNYLIKDIANINAAVIAIIVGTLVSKAVTYFHRCLT
jgi:hypothetical protein